jgi:hypothetical protein
VTGAEPRRPEDLTDRDRESLRVAHQRLRKASQDCESLVTATSPRGRWQPTPVPPEVLASAGEALTKAYQQVWRLHRDLLGWAPPEPPA